MDEGFAVTGYAYRVVPVDDYWVIWYPELPGCSTHANAVDEIGREAEAVLATWIASEIEQRHSLPGACGDGFPDMWGAAAYTVAPDDEPNYLIAADVAPMLGLSRRRLNTIAQTRGVGRLVGGIRIFRPEDVEALRPGLTGRPRKAVAA